MRRAEVVALHFDGNEDISDGELRAVIRTRGTRCASLLLAPFCAVSNWGFVHRRAYLDTLEVAADELRLRTYYQLRGYFESEIGRVVRTDGLKARVWFTVTEGRPALVDSLIVNGLPESVRQETGATPVGMGPGDPFDRIRLQAGKDSLVQLLRERGYVEALILEDTRRTVGGGAIVRLDVRPGTRFRLGDIRVTGAGALGEGVIRDLVPLRPGQYYSQEAEEEGQRNLFALDAIRFASIRRERSPPEAVAAADSTVDLVVQITPAQTRTARGGVGWSTDACFQTEVRLAHRNLFGGARRFELTGRFKNIFARQLNGVFPCSGVGSDSNFWRLNFLLQAEILLPVLFSSRNSFRANFFFERETIPDVFIREGQGAEFGVTHRLGRRMTATLSYAPEFTGFDRRSADIFFCVNFGFCAPADIEVVTQARWLAPVTLGWVYNQTDDPLQPTSGFYLAAETEAADAVTGSSYGYLRGAVQGAAFAELEPGLVAGLRVRAGVAEPTRVRLAGGPRSDESSPPRSSDLIHPSKRFFAGGSQSVRGFGQNLLGPRVLVASQAEDCPLDPIPACVKRLAAEDPGAFDQRPNGGDASIELSIELRRRLSSRLGLVLFMDAGTVSEDISNMRPLVWTPGAGLRFVTPVGSVRLDVGYNPSAAVSLPVIVSADDGTLAELADPVLYDPFRFDDPSRWLEIWRRLQVHISIGEAF